MMGIKKIDSYIIKKFLGTFFFAIALIIVIAVVFDISEKIDDFIEKEAPLSEIAFDYYLNFIPYFINLFSPLFVFIAVIFFTSKMAANTEIVAILSAGVSFRRLLMPYIFCALILAVLSFILNGWVIPHATEERLLFEEKYIRKQPYSLKDRNVHRQIAPGEFIYFNSYSTMDKTGYQFSYEKFEDQKLTFKIISNRILWDSTSGKWKLENYFIRTIDSTGESIRKGYRMDTTFAFHPKEFSRRIRFIQAMDNGELDDYIKKERLRGSENVPFYLVEKHKRGSYPFATFILTIIGVSVASRKVRGGIGIQIGLGLFLSFTYILFMQVTTTFATNGNVPALIAVWIPNIVFSLIALFLLRNVPK